MIVLAETVRKMECLRVVLEDFSALDDAVVHALDGMATFHAGGRKALGRGVFDSSFRLGALLEGINQRLEEHWSPCTDELLCKTLQSEATEALRVRSSWQEPLRSFLLRDSGAGGRGPSSSSSSHHGQEPAAMRSDFVVALTSGSAFVTHFVMGLCTGKLMSVKKRAANAANLMSDLHRSHLPFLAF